jgi:hypothetical protein
MTALALGPVLGTMDSTDLEFQYACTPNSLEIVVTIRRSSEQSDSLKFGVWRPKIALKLADPKSGRFLYVTWKMQTPDGHQIVHGDLPTGLRQTYPIHLGVQIP